LQNNEALMLGYAIAAIGSALALGQARGGLPGSERGISNLRRRIRNVHHELFECERKVRSDPSEDLAPEFLGFRCCEFEVRPQIVKINGVFTSVVNGILAGTIDPKDVDRQFELSINEFDVLVRDFDSGICRLGGGLPLRSELKTTDTARLIREIEQEKQHVATRKMN
jgi:hypothetical protein